MIYAHYADSHVQICGSYTALIEDLSRILDTNEMITSRTWIPELLPWSKGLQSSWLWQQDTTSKATSLKRS